MQNQPLVAVIMGSTSDMGTMRYAIDVLEELGIPYETRIVSAHRTPDLMFRYAEGAKIRGIQVIISGAGGSAHLPGMTAAKTVLPVIGVPVASGAMQGIDALLSIVQMPRGVPVGTVAIGKTGSVNAALFAAQIIGLQRRDVQERLEKRRAEISAKVEAEHIAWTDK